MDTKQYRELERIIKGCANHRRIELLEYFDKHPESSVFDVADELAIDFRTASHHIKQLAVAGLVMKRSDGNMVRHALTSRGKTILKFLRTLE